MRKLAARLGVQAGALYWHFASKQALLDAMADKLVEGVADQLPPGPWDERLGALAHRLRQALLSHRDGARVMAGTYVPAPSSLAAGTAAVDVLCKAGFPAERAAWVIFALMHYVLGHTIEEQAQTQAAQQGSAWEAKQAEWEATHAELNDTPQARALGAVIQTDPAERFAYGLAIFLDGIRHRLAR